MFVNKYEDVKDFVLFICCNELRILLAFSFPLRDVVDMYIL